MALQGLFTMIGSLAEGAINKSAQEDANAANIQMTRETNASNREMQQSANNTNMYIADATNRTNQEIAEKTNEFNAAQADKAYERSTSSSKVAELIAAGMSPQQARMIVATNGLTGTATPATGTAIPAQAAQVQASKDLAPHVEPERFQGLAQGLGALGQGIDSMTSAYFGSFSAPDGGYVGAILSSDVYDKVSSRIGEIPANVLASPHSFQLWLSNQKEGYWHDIAASPDFQKMWSHPLGRRSFLYQLTSTYADSASISNSLALQELQIKRQNLAAINDNLQNKLTDAQVANEFRKGTLLDEQIEAQDIANQTNQIYLERDKATAELVTDAEIAALRLSISDANLQNKLLSDPVYCDIWFKSQLSNKAMGLAMNSYVAMLYEGRNTWLKAHPKDASAMAVFSMFDELGFANTTLFRDLKENYVAGGSFGTYIAREYSNPSNRGWYKGMYDFNLNPLWNWRAESGFDANFEPWMWQQGVNVVSGILDKGIGLLEDYVMVTTATGQNRTLQMEMEKERHQNRMTEIREQGQSYHRSRSNGRRRR